MSNEEQYKKHIEDKVRQAAQSQVPIFNEAAWDKLSQRLDEKDKRRRGIFWWLPLMVATLSVGSYFYFSSNKDSNKELAKEQIATVPSQSSAQPTKPTFDKSGSPNTNGINQAIQNNDLVVDEFKKVDESLSKSSQKEQKNVVPGIGAFTAGPKQSGFDENNTFGKRDHKLLKSKIKKAKPYSSLEYTSPIGEMATQKKSKPVTEVPAYTNSLENSATQNTNQINSQGASKVTITNGDLETSSEINGTAKVPPTETTPVSAISEKIDIEKALSGKPVKLSPGLSPNTDSSKATEHKTATKTAKKPQKESNSKGLYIKAGFGFENAATSMFGFNKSTVAPRLMAHVGYQFNNRWSVDVGFISSSKKYKALATDYVVKAGSYLSRVNILGIDADCKVYELPLTVQYNFLNLTKHRLFFNGGFSSYIMKNEDYAYRVVDYLGARSTQLGNYTKNTHLLATANLGFGWQYQLSKNTGLWFNPSLSIPLGGVGEGQIKLYTSGINFGLKQIIGKK